jgi:hypothetical protein
MLVEAGVDEIDSAVAITRAAMAEASTVVLGGLEVGTDADMIRWPDRYADKRGRVMFERVIEILERQEGQGGQEGKEGRQGQAPDNIYSHPATLISYI